MRRRRRILIALVLLPLCALAAEGAARLALRARGTPFDGAEARRAFETATGSMDQLPGANPARGPRLERSFLLHPYHGWETQDMYFQTVQQLRAAEARGREGRFLVMVVGGSVSGLFANEAKGGAKELAALLSADPRIAGKEVAVLGQGRGAFKQPQQLAVVNVAFQLGLVPDVLINIDGFNEVAISVQNLGHGAHPLFPSFSQWGELTRRVSSASELDQLAELLDARQAVLEGAHRALDRGYARSALLSHFALRSVERDKKRYVDAQRVYSRSLFAPADGGASPYGPPFRGAAEEAVELAVASWKESSLVLKDLCARHGVTYLHVLQPTLHDAGAKVATPEEEKSGSILDEWKQGVELGYPRLRTGGAELAREGVAFLDASRVFADVAETLYYDACHFNVAGNELLARRIADALLAALPE